MEIEGSKICVFLGSLCLAYFLNLAKKMLRGLS